MLRYVLKRLLIAIPTLFAIVTIAFFLMRIAPGGPFNQERGLTLDQGTTSSGSITSMRRLWQQYLYYLRDLLRGDLGPSYNLPDFTVADLFRTGLPYRWSLAPRRCCSRWFLGGALGIVAALNLNKDGR